jgi:hypothetical protein
VVASPIQPNKTQWPLSGPIQIYINTKKSHTKDFLTYLDHLIKSLPGWSETEYELRWADNLDAIEANLGKQKKLSKRPRCVAIIIDEENQEKQYLPYRLANLQDSSYGFSAAILHDTENDNLNMYRDNKSSLYVKSCRKPKFYQGTNGINIKEITKNHEVPNNHWPFIQNDSLQNLLKNLANYFIFLGRDLGIINDQQVSDKDLSQLVQDIILRRNQELPKIEAKKEIIQSLKKHWVSICKTVKLFSVRDKQGNLSLAYNFAIDHSNFNPWPTIGETSLTEFPNPNFLKELCGKNKITTVDDLKKVFEYLGVKTITLSDDELAKYLIEEAWDKLSAQYDLFKFPGNDGKEKVFYSYCKQIKSDTKSSDGIDLMYFPSSRLIKSKLNKPKVDSSADLKKFWSSLGIESANDEEEKLLPRLLIERYWDEVSKNTNIYKIKTDDGQEKYSFRFASGDLDKWGKVGRIGLLRFFFDKTLVKRILEKESITSIGDLQKVFNAIGLSVAEATDEKDLPKKIIETHWEEISKHTGIIQFQNDNGKTKYSFNFAGSPSLLSGCVPGAGTKAYSSFPSPDFTEEILGSQKRTQKTIDDMKKVWQAMGLDIACPEDEKNLFRKLIEDNWDAISESTDIIRNPDGQGFQYDFSNLKSKNTWKTVGNYGSIASFPSINFIREVLGPEARAIRSREDLKKVWSALGLKILN